MTTRNTNPEWAALIAQTTQNLALASKPYPTWRVGSSALNKTVDHTLLKLEATGDAVDALCAEARVGGFATVCVRPNFVEQAVKNLKGSNVKVASVIGFHEGTYDLYHKIQETKLSLTAGASELDIVINHPLLHGPAPDYSTIYNELATLRQLAPHPTLLKLIFETSQLSEAEIIAAATLAAAAEFDFIKTSSGFCGRGATVEDVRLMRACCEALAVSHGDARRAMKVKASGGVRTLDDALRMLEAGAERLGTSAGVWISKEAGERAEGRGGVGEGERPGLATRLYTDY
ncbi:hypothetical protein MBLNU230_g6779t2 [Neophaeotheca triangularis]